MREKSASRSCLPIESRYRSGHDAPSSSDYQIRMEGWRALTERLGISGAMRFMMQYDPGYGDYTKERAGLLADLTLDGAIRQMKSKPNPS